MWAVRVLATAYTEHQYLSREHLFTHRISRIIHIYTKICHFYTKICDSYTKVWNFGRFWRQMWNSSRKTGVLLMLLA